MARIFLDSVIRSSFFYVLVYCILCFHFAPLCDVCLGDTAVPKVDKKEREHLLALNQVLARQVMEKSRMVAGTYMSVFLFFNSNIFGCVQFPRIMYGKINLSQDYI